MSAMASQITNLTIVYLTIYSGADQRKHQSSASLAFVRGIHRWTVNSPHKWPVTRKNVSIWWRHYGTIAICCWVVRCIITRSHEAPPKQTIKKRLSPRQQCCRDASQIARFMGPVCGRQDPGGPRVGPMNLATWVVRFVMVISLVRSSKTYSMKHENKDSYKGEWMSHNANVHIEYPFLDTTKFCNALWCFYDTTNSTTLSRNRVQKRQDNTVGS